MLLSLLLVGGLGAALRWYFGKQRWYMGLLFFIVLTPLSLFGLLSLALMMGVDATVATAWTEAFTGSLVGAFLLSSSAGYFLDRDETKEEP